MTIAPHPTRSRPAPRVPSARTDDAVGPNGRPNGSPAHPALVPPLVDGDHLTRAEFHRRYEAMPSDVRAELIEGVVCMASPVSHVRHGQPHLRLGRWLGRYLDRTPALDEWAGDNSTVVLDDRNEPQPDLLLSLPPAVGGRSVLEGGYLVGPPTLAIEVAASSAAIDLHRKLDAYRVNGVAEYLVWRTDDAAVDWFLLRGNRYDRQSPDDDGLVKSEAFPGLWLDPAALVARDLPRLFAAIDAGCSTPEHAAFVERLASVR